MGHPGLDIYMNGRRDTIAAGHDGLKTVGWLTLISKGLAEQIGGVRLSRESCQRTAS